MAEETEASAMPGTNAGLWRYLCIVPV
jgi:hypothetical protein